MSTPSMYGDKLSFLLIKLPDAARQGETSFIRKNKPDYLLEVSGLNLMCKVPTSSSDEEETIRFPETLDCTFFLNYGDLFLCVANCIENSEFLEMCIFSFFHEALEKRRACDDVILRSLNDKKNYALLQDELLKANSEYKKAFSSLAFVSFISLVMHEDKKLEGLFDAAVCNLLSNKKYKYGSLTAEQLQSNLNEKNLFSEITMTVAYQENGEEWYTFRSLFDLIGFEVRQLKNSQCCIKECENCGRLFMPANRSDEKYCNYLFDGTKSCKQSAFSSRLDKDEILKTYRKIYKTQNARKQRNSHRTGISDRFSAWAEYAKKRLDDCQSGRIPLSQMIDDISSPSWMEGNIK